MNNNQTSISCYTPSIMNNNQTLAQFFGITFYPFIIDFRDKNGRVKYKESEDGYWEKRTYQIYHGEECLVSYENSRGVITRYDERNNMVYRKSQNGDCEEYIFDKENKLIQSEQFIAAKNLRKIFDNKNRLLYASYPDGTFIRSEYDDSKEIYRETQEGIVFDHRKKKITLKEIAEKFGISLEHIEIIPE